MFLRARYYDPVVGRFLSRDPWEGDLFHPQTLNGWSYVENNPARYTDPSGHGVPVKCWVCELEIDISDWPGWAKSLAVAASYATDFHVDLEQGLITGPTEQEWVDAAVINTCANPIGMVRQPVVNVGRQAIDELAEEATGHAFRSFTKRNFRENLRRLTGSTSEQIRGIEAHHVLPDEFVDEFSKMGINIHDPKFGSWVEQRAHRSWSYEYNRLWERFFQRFKEQGVEPTNRQMLEFAQQLAERYGFDVYFTVP